MVSSTFSQHEDLGVITAFIVSAPHLINDQVFIYFINVFSNLYILFPLLPLYFSFFLC